MRNELIQSQQSLFSYRGQSYEWEDSKDNPNFKPLIQSLSILLHFHEYWSINFSWALDYLKLFVLACHSWESHREVAVFHIKYLFVQFLPLINYFFLMMAQEYDNFWKDQAIFRILQKYYNLMKNVWVPILCIQTLLNYPSCNHFLKNF